VTIARPGAGVATAVSMGSAVVTATDPATGINGTAAVTVTPVALVVMSVAPVTVNILTGQTYQLTATGTMSDSTTIDETSAVNWTSSSPAVYVSSAGILTGVSVGSATITATDPATGIAGTATVSVGINTNDSVANEFSPYVNPVGNWTFGWEPALGGALTPDTGNWTIGTISTWADNGAFVYHNGGATTDYEGLFAMAPNELALSVPSWNPMQSVARWTAPSSGTYQIAATFSSAAYTTCSNTEVYQCLSSAPCSGVHAWTSVAPGAVWSDPVGNSWFCPPSSLRCYGALASGSCGFSCGTRANDVFEEVVAENKCTTQNTTGTVSVLKNNAVVFQGQLLAAGGNYDATLGLNAGDVLDFAYGSNSATSFARLDVQINAGATCASLNAPGPGTLVGLKLSPTAANVTGAGSTQFKALAYYSNQPTTPVDVTSQSQWTASGSDLAIGAVGSVGYSGTDFATGSVGATFGGLSASAAVRVWDPAHLAQVQSLTLSSPAGGTGGIWWTAEGQCDPVTDTATYSDGTTEDVTATTLWSGDEPVLFGNLLVINGTNSQYLTLNATLGAGLPSTSQTVYVGDSTLFAATCSDPRIPGPAWHVYVTPASTNVYQGQTFPVSAKAYFADGSTRDVSAQAVWVSCSGAVDVASDGWITGIQPGSTTSVLAAVGSMGGGNSVTVTPSPQNKGSLSGFFVQPTANNLTPGATAPMRAVAIYGTPNGVLYNVTAGASWSTSDPTVVTVSPTATGATSTTTAVGTGTAKVIGSWNGLRAAETVRVWSPARLSQLVSVTPSAGEFPTCSGEQATMTASFSDGTSEDVTASTQFWQAPFSSANGSPIYGDSGYGFLSSTSYFSPTGPYEGYVDIISSLGRGILQPTENPVGIWGTCPGPTCSDGIQDGYETGVDCGGPSCAPCPSGQGCLGNPDCASGACSSLVCQ
jgi:hypothetical protein